MSLTRSEFQQLYVALGPAVRARCRAVCGNEADADEALQETFIRAWRARQRFDGRHPLAWLQTIGRNASLDILRKRRPWKQDPSLWLNPRDPRNRDPASRADARRLLDGFKPDDAALLRLRHAQEWRIHEIAEHFDTSPRTIRRRLKRLERRAKAMLGVEEGTSHAS